MLCAGTVSLFLIFSLSLSLYIDERGDVGWGRVVVDSRGTL